MGDETSVHVSVGDNVRAAKIWGPIPHKAKLKKQSRKG